MTEDADRARPWPNLDATIATILDRTEGIDGIVDNGDVDSIGVVEETTVDEALKVFDTNIWTVA